jgi:hypothetical protein
VAAVKMSAPVTMPITTRAAVRRTRNDTLFTPCDDVRSDAIYLPFSILQASGQTLATGRSECAGQTPVPLRSRELVGG